MKVGLGCLEFTKRKGIGRYVVELSHEISRAGHETHCHCIAWDRPLRDRVHIHRIHTLNIVNTSRLATFAFFCRRSLEKGRYDITHTMGNVVGSDVITAHSCHKAGMKILGTPVGPADRFRLMVEQRNYVHRQYHHVIAVARGVKNELMQEYGVPGNDISVIPNGVNMAEFNASAREAEGRSIRERLGLSRDDIVALFVGNEFDRKGLTFVIRALPLTGMPRLNVIVAGGDDSSSYQRMAREASVADRIHFVGSIGDIAPYYAASDMFVLPSGYEAFSLATLEASASGLPILTTRINGSEELIEDGVNGFFIERDVDSLARRLSDVAGNEELRKRLSANARKSVEGYSWEVIGRRIMDVYDEVYAMKSRGQEGHYQISV